MFETYLKDSYSFYSIAITTKKSGNEAESKKYYRASTFCAMSAMEAFINFMGSTLSSDTSIDKNEVAFLNDQIVEVIPNKACTVNREKFYSLEDKIKYLIAKLHVPIDPGTSPEWSFFKDFKTLRDSLVHSRENEDENTCEYYEITVKNGLNSNIEIMNHISKMYFQRPLRTALLELKL